MQPEKMPQDRRAALFVVAGAGTAIVSIPLAAAGGPPYLSFGSISPWLVTYAIGLFAALFATPFLIHARLTGDLEADSRWERALLWWAAVALAVLVASVICGLPSGFGSSSLGGAIGLAGVTESVLVLATLTFWLLSN
ncbi:MAG: hypothetical protein QOI10_2853 [Solirubrobacterales bacterium]|jgi:hypothetical protein|nr:hypothetical protein [Solirubrobacterales bacterium]